MIVCIQMDSKGTIKLLDGVYVGDEQSCRDQQLILLNHITTIINLTSLPNYYLHYDIHYLKVEWSSLDLAPINQLITQAREQGESILLHGRDSLDHPVCVVTIYLMQRFRWSLFKTLEFINSRIQGLTFAPQTFQILKRYELNMLNEQTRLSYNWQRRSTDEQELVLRNTFLNSTQKDKCNINAMSQKRVKQKRRISWKIDKAQSPIIVVEQEKAKGNPFRNQILLSVRKILNKQQNDSAQSRQVLKVKESNEQTPTLKKYKSTYTLSNLPLYKGQYIKTQIQSDSIIQKIQQLQNSKEGKRSKTQQSEKIGLTNRNNQITSIIIKNSKSLTRVPNDSLKKIKIKNLTKQKKSLTRQSFR